MADVSSVSADLTSDTVSLLAVMSALALEDWLFRLMPEMTIFPCGIGFPVRVLSGDELTCEARSEAEKPVFCGSDRCRQSPGLLLTETELARSR